MDEQQTLIVIVIVEVWGNQIFDAAESKPLLTSQQTLSVWLSISFSVLLPLMSILDLSNSAEGRHGGILVSDLLLVAVVTCFIWSCSISYLVSCTCSL